jgi:CobW/HypB/UreG, nucleotide-binding domain
MAFTPTRAWKQVKVGAIRITILTGFLGAGKTTLVNRFLNSDHGLRVEVLVNDFGAINIDTEPIVGLSQCKSLSEPRFLGIRARPQPRPRSI